MYQLQNRVVVTQICFGATKLSSVLSTISLDNFLEYSCCQNTHEYFDRQPAYCMHTFEFFPSLPITLFIYVYFAITLSNEEQLYKLTMIVRDR